MNINMVVIVVDVIVIIDKSSLRAGLASEKKRHNVDDRIAWRKKYL